MEWRWIDKRVLLLLHDESLAEHGGGRGLRDEGLLDSALAGPLHLVASSDPDITELAACHAFGLAKHRAFIAGSKRVAFLALGLFLHLNGWRLGASQAHATPVMLDVAAGKFTELELAAWIKRHAQPRATTR